MEVTDIEPVGVPAKTAAVTSHEATHLAPAVASTEKPANALTPPTSEEMNHDEVKVENEESELSDLDMDDDDDDLEDIEPDHYWDNGKIPVFKPTMDQFRSFKKFMGKIDKYGMKSGIVKVIPPKEWRESLPTLDENVKRIKIKNPITQEFNGAQGIYTQQNVEKQRSYNLPEWKSLTESTHYQPPAKRGERRRNQEKVLRGAAAAAVRKRSSVADEAGESDDSPKPKRKPGRPPRRRVANDEEAESGNASEAGVGNRFRSASASQPPAAKAAKAEKKPRGRQPKSGGPGQARSVTSRRLNNIAESVDYVDEEAFENFSYNIDDLDGYTPDRCAELETHYWKSLGFNQPMYAADMPGSLFDDNTTSWNVAKLENLLDVLGTKVPGVNTAYLYMGMWKATFAWHLEDVDLYSINYIHFGAPKQWYSISQEDARKFEKAMKSIWPVDSKNCDQFLRHKTYLISPDILQRQYGVKVNKLVHYEGEFVITFPYGYHSGYNIGYNCAESVNFATESWLEYGKIARKCNCESDNVWVDVFEIERKLRGEPTPEYIEETDDDSEIEDEDGHLPSPPSSVKGKTANRKRKRGAKPVEASKKKKKIRIKIRVPTREPCGMCPNENAWEPLLPTDNGKKAHRSCVLYTPETWIVKYNGAEMACGVGNIGRSRLDLKCNFCRSKRGACFQCSSKKCTRAFHATCALAAGVQVDAGMVPTFGEDGTEYFEEGFDFRCKYHRPKMPKNLTLESLEGNKRLVNYARDLKPKDVIQAQYFGGEVFAGLVVENRPGEMSVVVDVLFEGERVEVEWKWLCLLDPDESLRPKPTANAIPMPEGMNKQAVSLSNRQDGVPTQDEVFHDNSGFKWHDFFNIDMPPPGYLSTKLQVPLKLDVKLDSLNQPFFYLPTKSTEARCFFSDRPGSNEVAPMSNFLELVQPAKPVVNRQSNSRPSIAAAPQAQRATNKYGSSFNTFAPVNMSNQKPYTYKPKQSSMWNVDQQALANQRNFLAGTNVPQRASPQSAQVQGHMQTSPSHEASRTGTPLRAFPNDQYYSTTTLPAAFPGEHSAFRREAARRESQGAQSMTPASDLDRRMSITHALVKQEHPAQVLSAIPGVGMSSVSRPTSSSAGYHSPYLGPLTPATTKSGLAAPKSSDGDPQDQAYLENLRLYPYLLESFCRRPARYESPYSLSAGFASATAQPEVMPTEPAVRNNVSHSRTLSTSVSSHSDVARPSSEQWTPPSQVWGRSGVIDQNSNTSQYNHYGPAHQTLPPMSMQPGPSALPSPASRDGAQARLLRDQGYTPCTPQPASFSRPAVIHNGVGGQMYEISSSQAWQSPKAPTPSPLSDSQSHSGAPSSDASNNHNYYSSLPAEGQTAQWPPAPAPAPAASSSSSNGRSPAPGGYGYGSMMPHSGGAREAWRYG